MVAREARRNGVKRWTALAAFFAQSVTVAALFGLKYYSALTFERGAALEQFGRNWSTAPCVHHWRPRGIRAEMSERRQ